MFNMFGKSDLREEELVLIERVRHAFEMLSTDIAVGYGFQLRGIEIRRKPHGKRELVDYEISGRVLHGGTFLRFSTQVTNAWQGHLCLGTVRLKGVNNFAGFFYPREVHPNGEWKVASRTKFNADDRNWDDPEGFSEALKRFGLSM